MPRWATPLTPSLGAHQTYSTVRTTLWRCGDNFAITANGFRPHWQQWLMPAGDSLSIKGQPGTVGGGGVAGFDNRAGDFLTPGVQPAGWKKVLSWCPLGVGVPGRVQPGWNLKNSPVGLGYSAIKVGDENPAAFKTPYLDHIGPFNGHAIVTAKFQSRRAP